MAATLYCPVCGGKLNRFVGGMWVKRGYRRGAEFASQIEYAACSQCALVSQVDSRTWTMIDLGNITLQDCLEPIAPAVFVMTSPSPLNGRADS